LVLPVGIEPTFGPDLGQSGRDLVFKNSMSNHSSRRL
jgi:hypothetical protein